MVLGLGLRWLWLGFRGQFIPTLRGTFSVNMQNQRTWQSVSVSHLWTENKVDACFHLPFALGTFHSLPSIIRKWCIYLLQVSHTFTFFMSYSACWLWFHNTYCLWGHETDIITRTRGVGSTGVRIVAARLWGLNQFCVLARSLAYWACRLTLLKMAATSKPNRDLWHLTICWLLEEKKIF